MRLSRRGILAAGTTAAAVAATTVGPSPEDPWGGRATAAPAPADATAWARHLARVPEVFARPATAPDHAPAIVIGTGFGGAVAGYRLGQAGVRTVMLERGLPWPRDPWREIFSPELPPDGRAVWHREDFTGFTGVPLPTDRFGGVLDVTAFEHIQVWRGAAVGGGSVVFTGVLLQPERRFFDAVFGGRVDYDEMDAVHYPLARRMLRASPMPDDVYRSAPFGHSRLWDDQAVKAGYAPQRLDSIFDWEVVRSELAGTSRKSAIIGESNFGNANAAKYDLTQNYLPRAVATGHVSIHHGHLVRSIGRDRQGRYTATVDVINPAGQVVRTQTLTCDRLFLGAGSIGTSELLVRAKATGTLPALPEAVGAGWGTNGDASLVRSSSFSEGDTQGSPSASRILDETGMPVSLESWYVPGVPVNIGLLGSLGMALDTTRASFRYDPQGDVVALDWPADGNSRAVAALRAVHDRIAQANRVPTGVPFAAADVWAGFTAHPLGGAVLGDVTDSYGRVGGHPGLYVVDGAGIPGSTGTANPALTITALAERAMGAVIGDRL